CDLEAICLKCLEKAPVQRYHSAEALADDLDRWLQGEPLSFRPRSRVGRLVRRIFRHTLTRVALCLLALATVIVPGTFYWSDRDRPVKNLERCLRQGKGVTLIGETGPPSWHQWRLRQGAVLAPAAGGAFKISALNSTLLMLLRDPQGSYRFSALVQHNDISRLGEVGLYFVHSQHETAQGVNHCYCTLTFSDREALQVDPTTKAPCSRVNCNVWRSQDPVSESNGPLASKCFNPAVLAGPAEYPWRELAVEVRPDGLEVFWEGKSFARVPHAMILAGFQDLKLIRINERMVDLFPDLHPSFTPHDALGLYAVRGGASYRNVEVKPLP
ncbi:MAG: hypothetical protein ACYC6M_15710, partial [Terriglobales bacterium]